jgi:hypothetical protein
LTACGADPEAELRAVSEKVTYGQVITGEMSKNIENELSLSVFSSLHHLSDRVLALSHEVPLGDSENIKEDVINLSLALEFVAERGFLLFLRKFSEAPNVFRSNLVRDDREALEGSLVLRGKF